MIGTLLLGSLAFQTVLWVGGPQDDRKPTYDPVLHISHVHRAPRKAAVRVERKTPATPTKTRGERTSRGARAGILEASTRRRQGLRTDLKVPKSLVLTWTRGQLAQNLKSAKERRVVLPLLRVIEIADWHLTRGARQGRTDLHAEAELGLAIQGYRGASTRALAALRQTGAETTLGRKLLRVKALSDQGAVETCLALSRLQLVKGAPQGARRWIRVASKIGPTDSEVLMQKARVDRLLGKN